MSDRDKKTLRFGGLVVILILLGGKVFFPIYNSWTATGGTLEIREAYIDKIALRVESREKLMTRKQVLSMRIGSLNVLQVKKPEEKKPEEKKPEEKKPEEKKPEEKKPEEKKLEVKKLEVKKPEEKKPEEKKLEEKKLEEKKPEEEKPEEEKPEEEPASSPEQSDVKKAELPKDKNADAPKESGPKKSPVPTIKASSLATYVEKNAKTAGVKIKRITPKKNSSGRKRTKYFQPVTIQFSFECKIKDLVTLLNDFENGEQFIRIDQIQINRDTKKGDTLTVSMELSSYEAQEGTS